MSDPATLQSLPLFPLGTVLFPGGLLPLRIFEVRYLDMIQRCHRAGAPFGVVTLTQGVEVRRPDGPAERFEPIGTLARIDQLEQVQAGLLLIRCSGLQRFRIQASHQLRHGLWVGDVVHVADDPVVPVPDDLRAAGAALQRLVDSLRERGLGDAELPMTLPLCLDDCGWVANRWCELLPLAPHLKQQLMQLDNPLVRLELISDLLERQGITGNKAGQPPQG